MIVGACDIDGSMPMALDGMIVGTRDTDDSELGSALGFSDDISVGA